MFEFETLDTCNQPAKVTIRGLDRISGLIKRTQLDVEDNILGYDYCALVEGEFFELTKEEYNRLYETFLPENQ